MNPILLSSGDLLADRRASYAEMLLEGGDTHAAADLMRDTLTLAPGWAAGWFRLREMLEIGRTRDVAKLDAVVAVIANLRDAFATIAADPKVAAVPAA